ncbi:hypothetical protein SAMN05192552_10523 [Natrinema hispanicum]|uniref:Uncharacterized protein n=1 Tax=Natrinema hispanicum TaxID=392421 RepID=A0A1G6XT18_9EURY|nr:hypothetical protein SAMN05192552_10523 [Natrinema hispanicum]
MVSELLLKEINPATGRINVRPATGSATWFPLLSQDAMTYPFRVLLPSIPQPVSAALPLGIETKVAVVKAMQIVDY